MEISGNTYYQQQTVGNSVSPYATGASTSKGQSKVTSSNSANNYEQQKIGQEVLRLKEQEQKVIAHERAHQSAGGQYAGSASYQYTTGPDGKRYITGGEVQIDISPENTPSGTIRKMDQVKRAALAPADPSPQDRSVAASADAVRQKAQQDLLKEKTYESSGGHSSGTAMKSLNISIFG